MPRPKSSKKTRNSGTGVKVKEKQTPEDVKSKINLTHQNFKKLDDRQKQGNVRTEEKLRRGNRNRKQTADEAQSSSRVGTRTSDNDTHEILRKVSSKSSLDVRYKIPKKKAVSQDGDISGAKGSAGQSTNKSYDLSSGGRAENSDGQRKRKSESAADDALNSSRKKHCLGNSGTKPPNVLNNEIPKIDMGSPKDAVCHSSLNSRPKVIARRSNRIPSNKPITNPTKPAATQDVINVDTPQMALLKAKLIARHNEKRKGSPIQRNEREKGISAHERERTSSSKIAEQKAPTLLQSPVTNIATIAEPEVITAPSVPVLSSNDEDFDDNVPVPDFLQLFKNESDTFSQIDTTDAMDVDIIQSTPNQSKQLVVILDTNIWISHRPLIQEILEMNIPASGNTLQPTVIIPWMVLQEIDHNIHNKTKTIEFKKAAKYIHGLLSSKHPRVKGQQATDAIIGMEFNELMADDSILNCAIQCNKISHFQGVLITNDINLLNKALVHNLTAFSADRGLLSNLHNVFCESDRQIINELHQPSTFFARNSFMSTHFFCASPLPVPPAPSTSHTLNISDQICISSEDVMDVDDPMGNVESIDYNNLNTSSPCEDQQPVSSNPTFDAVATALQQTLTSIIVPKMAEEYGSDGWKYAIKFKPPFTVESGLKCLQAHWIAVFSFIFPSRGKEVVDELVSAFQRKPKSADLTEIRSWRLNVCQMAKVLLTLNNNIASRPRVSACCRLLQEYIQFETNN